MSDSRITDEIEKMLALDPRGLKAEVDNLRAIEAWALSNLGIDYATGDRIEIVSERPSLVGMGWLHYSEALAVGQTGIAGDITFNSHANGWYVLVGLDRCWSTHSQGWPERTVRYWNGPADEAPEGHTIPGGYPPEGRVKYFSMPVAWVRQAES